MGTDIRSFVELKLQREQARPCMASIANINLPRDYQLFGLLAGVRDQARALIPPRGLPDHMGFDSRSAFEMIVDDQLAALEVDGACARQEADSWVAAGTSRYLDAERSRCSDPDAFGASWLTTVEVALVVEEYRKRWSDCPTELVAVLAMMRELDATKNSEARLVFWFKN